MIKKILLIILISLFTFDLSAKKKDSDEFRYEIVPMGVGTEGTALIKVYSYAKSQKKAIEVGKKNAVHGILFKGVPGGKGVYAQPPLVKPIEQETNKDFFDEFFESGEYLRFVTVSSEGIIDPKDMMRVGKNYKIGIVYTVSKNELRKYLEDNKIIKRLDSIF